MLSGRTQKNYIGQACSCPTTNNHTIDLKKLVPLNYSFNLEVNDINLYGHQSKLNDDALPKLLYLQKNEKGKTFWVILQLENTSFVYSWYTEKK